MKQLFEAFYERLFLYISNLIKSETVAEELVMDVFMKIWTGRESLGDINRPDAYLFRIARNKAIDFLRSAADDHRLGDLLWEQVQVASSYQADQPLLAREFEEKLREAIVRLPPQRRKIYHLSREEMLSHDQIADRLHISRSSVNNQLVQAQRSVRSYLAKSMDLPTLFIITGSLFFWVQ